MSIHTNRIRAIDTLSAKIQEWIDEGCDQDWWTDNVGYVTDGTAERLASLVLMALDEARHSCDLAEKEAQ